MIVVVRVPRQKETRQRKPPAIAGVASTTVVQARPHPPRQKSSNGPLPSPLPPPYSELPPTLPRSLQYSNARKSEHDRHGPTSRLQAKLAPEAQSPLLNTHDPSPTIHDFDRESALCDRISTKFDAVITSIDGETFGGNEEELSMRFVFPSVT